MDSWYEAWLGGMRHSFDTAAEVMRWCADNGVDTYDAITYHGWDISSSYVTYTLSGEIVANGTIN